MKKLFTVATAVLLTATVWAQTPQKMSYQAVIRNSSNALVSSTQIGMEINIRKGSLSGTVVYTETQTPTTNANGLVSIEIGGGAGFNSIDWGSDNFYIETNTAVVPPLTTYTITGTSQLLSVPYALHAKTAETITGTITETDPVYSASVASGITGTDTINWNNKLTTEVDGSVTNEIQALSISNDTIYLSTGGFVKLPATDGSETKGTAGTNITLTGTGTTASPYVVNATTHYIGESYGGGIVFWVDAVGKHGLIASTSDQSVAIRWHNGSYTITGATLDAIYAGKANTNLIIATQGAGSYAAQLCADYSVTVNNEYYDDWYLPSRYELYLLSQQETVVGGFVNYPYWSSTEQTNSIAWDLMFPPGYDSNDDKNNAYRVRAIRAF